MVEMEVHRVQVSSRAYHRVILRARDGEANLHIVIGPAEARAISMAHRGQASPRPLSYDMARALLDESGARIEQVAITDLQDGIYYAEIHLVDEGGGEHVVDSRPSDAIALALRTGAPIFADEAVLDEDDEDWDEDAEADIAAVAALDKVEEDGEDEPAPEGVVTLAELLAASDIPLSEREQLEKRLRQAVSEEAYEEAARLRDRLLHLGTD